MEKKKKFIIMLGIMLIILAVGISIIVYIYNNTKIENTNNLNNQVTNSQPTNINKDIITVNINGEITEIEAPEENDQENEDIKIAAEKDEILKIAKNFAARFGTYSNQNDFENLVNLKSYMTEEMQVWIDEVIVENKNQNNSKYKGMSTQTANLDLIEYEQGSTAKVIVETIRTQQQQNKDPETFQQKLELQFKNEENSWKVNRATWKK